MPAKAGTKVKVTLRAESVEIYQAGEMLAKHPRNYEKGKEILNLEHYLDVLERKPGALAGSKPLQQYKEKGFWPTEYDQIWQKLEQRLGKETATKAMIELLQIGKEKGYEKLQAAIKVALQLGCSDSAAIKHLVNTENLTHKAQVTSQEILRKYETKIERPLPQISNYDQLLEVRQ